MAARNPRIDYMGIEFKDEAQQKLFEKLSKRTITAARYADETCLRTLGLFDSVNWMFNQIGWGHFLTLRHPTYERITLEFLSSLKYTYAQRVRKGFGGTSFRLFGQDFLLSHNEIGNLLQFQTSLQSSDGVPSQGPWTTEYGQFWKRLTGALATSAEGNKASRIHNPAIRYFHRVLAHTIFGRGDSTGVVNLRELYFIHCIFARKLVNSAAFMLAHMFKMATSGNGPIAFSGLITSIAYALGFSERIVPLSPVQGNTLIDLSSCLAQNLVKREGEMFCLMIRNKVENRIKLPNPTITDVRDEENWIYVFPDEEGEDTDAEIERQTRLSPPRPHAPHSRTSGAPHTHTHSDPPPSPHFHSDYFAGTATSHGSIEYELNALRNEVADLRAAQQERNDRDAERDHLMRVNSHMIRQMFTWMTQQGMPPNSPEDD